MKLSNCIIQYHEVCMHIYILFFVFTDAVNRGCQIKSNKLRSVSDAMYSVCTSTQMCSVAIPLSEEKTINYSMDFVCKPESTN